jgi:ribonucleoside-diphosphate reductase alpha chain
MDDILYKISEVGTMSKAGGGTSGFFGAIRPRGAPIGSGGESTGVHHQLTVFESLTDYISQGNVRRGSFAAYLPIDHKDIEEFLNIRKDGDTIQNLSIGVCVSDEWIKSMLDGDKEKRRVWGLVIKKRFESGYPYIFFTDNANKQAPKVYKDKGLKIHHSNLCTEIMLSDGVDESFVCDLSSLNFEKWNQWKDTDAVETLVYFLDSVMTEFINKTENMVFMKNPRKFAINQRALGIGALGWHTFLQSQMISFESLEAKLINNQIWKVVRKKADAATEQMAKEYGEPPLLKGYGRRNVTTLAVAPTTSSSFILGQASPSVEPLNSNYFVKDLAKGKFTYKNPYLETLLETKGKNTETVWKSILVKGGSVQHLEFLNQEEKDIFKTFGEISQKEVVIQAAARQKYIDQGQSLNLMIPPDTKPKDVNELIIFAWESGIKSLYYQRSANPAQELARSILACSNCEA